MKLNKDPINIYSAKIILHVRREANIYHSVSSYNAQNTNNHPEKDIYYPYDSLIIVNSDLAKNKQETNIWQKQSARQ
jgi:hypothetical protein